MTPSEALQHPWIKDNSRLSTVSFGDNAGDNKGNLNETKESLAELESDPDSPSASKQLPLIAITQNNAQK